jgi:crotonobetaine/carnitine-CoA ligase
VTAPAQLHAPAAGRTVADLLRAGAAAHPERELLVYEDPEGEVHSYSWASVLERSREAAATVAAAGVGRGDRVHLHLRNRPEFLFAWFGAALLGASIVPTNAAASVAEMAYIVGHAGTALSITEPDGMEDVAAARRESGRGGTVVDCEGDGLRGAGDLPVEAAAGAIDELAIIYTSGTTARPKGVVVTHANYLYAGEVVAKAIALRPDDRLIVALPLFHANAQYYSTMGALTAGATLVLLPRFSAGGFLAQCARHEATVASLFAAPIRMILGQGPQARRPRHRLRVCLFAQNLGAAEEALWDERVGAPLLQLYGMTETIGPPLMNPLWGERRADSLGKVALGYVCRVVGEDGADVAPGEPGRLLVGGVPGISLTRGYLDDAAATAALLHDGWLDTGDVVRVDADGYFTFLDRRKDMIKRAGENVAASEVEAVVREHPGVDDVAVIGVPDPIRDEAIVAFVVPVDAGGLDPDELIAWCAARLSKFRVPGAIELREALPRTAVGKVRKQRLREEYEKRRTACPSCDSST